jgi:hypothetical protein
MRIQLRYAFSLIVFFCPQIYSLTGPSTSANALFLYRNSNFHKDDRNVSNPDQTPNGIDVREVELQFYSDVDPYTRLSLLLSMAPKYKSDGTAVSEEWGIEPEEAYAETLTLPGVALKLGKFKAPLGKHNLMHPHAFPLIEAPLANVKLLGDEGLNDAGVSAAILLPTLWFNELTVQYLRGKGENSEFNSQSPGEGVGLIHWKNLLDLSDELTVELGGSFAQGGNSYRKTTSLSGADLTFRWRPTEGGKYTSVLWASEYLSRTQSQAMAFDEQGSGLASWVQFQFAERWSAVYRFDALVVRNTFDAVNLPNDNWERHSLGIDYSPSEFSTYRLELDQRHGGAPSSSGNVTERAIYLQANYNIGAHPAHSY